MHDVLIDVFGASSAHIPNEVISQLKYILYMYYI